MKPDYRNEPFSELPVRLHEWFEHIIQEAGAENEFRFWRAVLPAGSSSGDAVVVSHCLRMLFPERVKNERCRPIEAEFVLKCVLRLPGKAA